MKMTTTDTIAALALVVAIASAGASTWATLAVGKLGDAKQESELAGRIKCEGRATSESAVLALTNKSSQHSVELLFLNLHSPLDPQKRSSRSARYGEQSIGPLETAYFAFPSWTNDASATEVSFVMQWKAVGLDRVRVHTCELNRSSIDAKPYFAVAREEDAWLPPVRAEGFYIPSEGKIRKPKEK